MIDKLSQQGLFCILGREGQGRLELRGRLLGAWSREGGAMFGLPGGWGKEAVIAKYLTLTRGLLS